MRKIDAHCHIQIDTPELQKLIEEQGLELLNICVSHKDGEDWRGSHGDVFRQQAKENPCCPGWITTFDAPYHQTTDYIDQVIAGLQQDFDQGAVGCKVWKNIGMEIRKENGEFMQVDDPFLDPIFDFFEAEGHTVLMHIGEPRACWMPLNPESPHYGYYKANPKWHMYGREGFPAYETIMTAMDNRIAQHPNLRFVGAHIASRAYDVTRVDMLLDRFPNLALDTSARMRDLALQDRDLVRSLFQKHADRLLFGIDFVVYGGLRSLTPEQQQGKINYGRRCYNEEWDYFGTDNTLHVCGREVQGLGLANGILEKFYAGNAVDWYGLELA